jgi:RNA polymerase sigma-70 factor (ECF subfamily)
VSATERSDAGGPPAVPELTGLELAALRAREPAILERFYRLYFERVYSHVKRMVRDEHTAEDLTQEIFLHIVRALPSYDPARPLRPWVFTIATNKVRDHWSSRGFRDRARSLSAEDSEDRPAELAAGGRDPREWLEAGELGLAVQSAVDRLPDGLRETLLLRYFDGLSFAEIGRVLERNEIAVRKRYSRALEELRESLGDLNPFAAPREPHR